MPRSVTCDVRPVVGPGIWRTVGVGEALGLGKKVLKRCVECRGQVKAFSASKSTSQEAHIEHVARHAGCSLGDCYDGAGKRPHPVTVS